MMSEKADNQNPDPYQDPDIQAKLRQYIETDPDNLLESKHIRERPEANFKAIALERLAGKTWAEIGVIFGLSSSTCSNFYRKTCQKLRSHFQEILGI